MQKPEKARQISKPLTVGALCPSARAVASTSPWLLWAEGSAVWVKNADSDPSPSQPGCLWNLEQRCNVRENSSCLDEARSASLSTGACLPQFTLPVYLSIRLSVSLSASGINFAVAVLICSTLLICFSILLVFIACIHFVMPHTQCWLFGLHCLSISLLFSFTHSISLSPLFPLFALSSCPPPPILAPCLSKLLSRLPDCCIPALPSDRECCATVCCVGHVPVVPHHLFMWGSTCLSFFWIGLNVYPLC